MNSQHKKNKITILVIFAMSIIPFGIAWYFASNPEMLTLGKSNGDLITPPLTSEIRDFTGYDQFSADNIKELSGHWVLINLLPESACHEVCVEALYKTQQISLMLGKDISRVRRVAALYSKTDHPVFNAEWQADGHLLKMVLSPALQEKVNSVLATPLAEGMLLLMDPLGNLMMKYPSGYDAYKVKSDISKLLRISQIG
ncbi:hypothetical protein [Methylomonas sp. AM2-LC]|uniref:hypothetical protein n=1 Tax=Methylomonas sp. AM2-LC TaxID=3153301 RepID=UPI00326368D8